MQNIILHLDMNSFFASVEQQDNPAWRNKVVGVCEHLGGILIAASVQAKRWGIGTGTPVWEARKIYPKIILTHTHPDRYRLYNRKLVRVVSDYTDNVEVFSIDEVFLDITKASKIRFKVQGSRCEREDWQLAAPFQEAVRIAKEIKARMKREVGDYLTCGIGIASNKLLAKIASDLQKPDGLVVVVQTQNEKVKMQNLGVFSKAKNDLYNHLKLTDIPGIGYRMEKRLNALGIFTLRDLKNTPKSHLVAQFGLPGYHLYHMGQLESTWKPQVDQEEEMKSIGHMYTLPKEYRTKDYFKPVLYKLCEMVGKRLRRQQLMGNILHFHVHDVNNECFGSSRKIGRYIWDGRDIFLEAKASLRAFTQLVESWANFKLIGVTLAGLAAQNNQLSLFGMDEKTKRVDNALDSIDEKYGDFTVCRAPVQLAGRAFRDSIGFGRIKEASSWKESRTHYGH